MKNEGRIKAIFKFISRFITFFLLVAFVTTSCMALFVSVFAKTLNIHLTGDNLNAAAKLTFFNVVLLSLIFTIIDAIRREYTVQRPAMQIIKAAERIMQGDFSVSVKLGGFWQDDAFARIADCFNGMARELRSVETLRADFIANVSHEMKTPLAVMNNYAALLQADELPKEKRIEYARGIAENAHRTADMITNILKLDRLENQTIFPNTAEFDLGEQLCENLLQYESIWEKHSIELNTDIAENVTMFADAELLSLVWNNLFSNAFKFTPDGGEVFISLAADAACATVKISDTGCGMSAEVGAHIFEKFYQGDSSHACQGNGLGLALVKRVMDILGGEISVESKLGTGTTFTVKLSRGVQ